VKKKRFTEQQIIGFLKEAEAGMPVKDLCRKHGFSDAAFYGWRTKFRGLHVNEAKRLRELEAENARLKKLLAEAHLDVEALKVAFGEVSYKPD
jgi:putative transposase